MARYGLPEDMQQSFDEPERFAMMIEIHLVAAQGGVTRWTTVPVQDPFSWQGLMWEPDNPFITTDDSRSFPGEEGTITIKIQDPYEEWFHKIRRSVSRGLEVNIHWVIGVSSNPVRIERYGHVPGRSQTVTNELVTGGNRETRLIVEDQMYFTRRDVGEYTSDSYQRSLNENDNSHQLAHKARKFNIHRAT